MSLLINVTKLAFLQDKGKYMPADSNVFFIQALYLLLQ